jgi:hypothetical protein
MKTILEKGMWADLGKVKETTANIQFYTAKIAVL